MSRLIIKNLPKKITEKKLRDLFSTKGIITDIQLKYNNDGVFRQFAFIGYASEAEAQEAIKFFHNSCIQTNRLSVELCAELGAHQSQRNKNVDSAPQESVDQGNERKINKKSKNEKIDEILGDHMKDPKFIEFLKAHKSSNQLWDNDLEFPTKSNEMTSDTERIETNSQNKVPSKYEKPSIVNPEKMERKLKYQLFTIKIRGIPLKTKREDILKFFGTNKPYSVRLPTKVKGFCYVGFKTEINFKKAMQKDRSFLKGHQLFFQDFTAKNSNNEFDNSKLKKITKKVKWIKEEEMLKHEEDISESGKLFFRNLAYSIQEEDLRKLFEEYGPIAELTLPVDDTTRQIKGFGLVTFMIPEHAVIAYSKLDGTVLKGRLLHLLPGKSNAVETEEDTSTSNNYKRKKLEALKMKSRSSYNWNTLFLGENAIAEILSNNHGVAKTAILDSNGQMSAAVRLALGETEIVANMRKFLEENDVNIEALDGVPSSRSKTVILAKNLPANTTITDIQPMFAKFGPLTRLLLPPNGITAIVEFQTEYEAMNAFKKLAYTKFKNLPLYLEWAPINLFNTVSNKLISHAIEPETAAEVSSENKVTEAEDIAENILEDDSPPEENTTLFLRNLNFITIEPTIRNHFKHLGAIHNIQIAMKRDPKNPKEKVSHGYGFIQFKKQASLEEALKTMQFTFIDKNKVELKRSDRILKSNEQSDRKQVQQHRQTGTKILVRNIPFQATQKEVRTIFQTFGELKSVRLPKKAMPNSDEEHRGFGFVDFLTESDAKRAMDALRHSTHLYGRRLVLEWAEKESDSIEIVRKRIAENNLGTDQKKPKLKAVFDTTVIENNTYKDE